MPEDKNIVRTSIKQPRELWNKVRTEAVNTNTTVDQVLSAIIRQHYEEKSQ